ncbi:hypothetical protein M422DRAFT_74814 [Sphaerobolus stellatus SS14]|nr:hypothetical protein M422DRAFT_74814 [Sphaerobolus stellatus SS14]
MLPRTSLTHLARSVKASHSGTVGIKLCRRSLATVSDIKILPDPSLKYQPYKPIQLANRQWPSKVLRSPPLWLSTDLRDGNQALPNPMNPLQKQKYFDMLVDVGFKEIEVAYPSSSETEFRFTRNLIERRDLPDDLWLQVLTPCRAELIKKTLESVAGAKNVIIHVYLGTAQIFRDVVFKKSRSDIIDLAIKSTAQIRNLTAEYAARYGTNFRFNFGVEGFSQAEPEFAVELCEAVKKTWGRAGLGNNRIMFNLAASVEIAPPNHFADQIEYFCRNITEREKVIVSLHPHNDMGTAVAAAQLGLLAGADRVEGCLLGHGERTGNVDLITMALNQYGQGISPRLDFSNLPRILEVVEECTGLPVNPRLPYSGKLAFTAFSGSHQDAIRKGFQAQEDRHEKNRARGEHERWAIPYLPFDPADIGCSYDALIRVNSQSGKAGVTSVLDQGLGLKLPRNMQGDVYKVVQKEAERTGTEVSARRIVGLFRDVYYLGQEQQRRGYIVLRSYEVFRPTSGGTWKVHAEIECAGASRFIQGVGMDAQSALLSALAQHLNISLQCLAVSEHQIDGTHAECRKMASYIQLLHPSTTGTSWGVGLDMDGERAGFQAVLSAVNVVIDNMWIGPSRTTAPVLQVRKEYHRQRHLTANL